MFTPSAIFMPDSSPRRDVVFQEQERPIRSKNQDLTGWIEQIERFAENGPCDLQCLDLPLVPLDNFGANQPLVIEAGSSGFAFSIKI